MKKTEKLIEDFIAHIKFQKRYSPHTTTAYATDIKQFLNYSTELYGQLDIEDISPTIIRSWLASLMEAQVTTKSLNRKISSLKSFFKYLLQQEFVINNPMLKIIVPKIAKRLPVYVEQKDIDILFNEIIFPEGLEGATQKLLLKIFYQSGVRLSELINLKVRNIDLGHLTIKVLGKGSKERIIPISKDLKEDIQQYLALKRQQLETYDAEVLLVNNKGKKLYPKYAYRVVTKKLEEVTTLEKKSPHVLRHTFATHLANKGAELNAIKELLGHSSLAATQIYMHNSIEKLKEIHTLAHPKS